MDLLLLTVAKPRKIHPDGVHLFGQRYLDPNLAAWVGEHALVRYDPRDAAEIRVFVDGRFVTRAVCPELAGTTIGFREIAAARRGRRRTLTRELTDRRAHADTLFALRAGSPADQVDTAPGTIPTPLPEPVTVGRRLKLYAEDRP